MPLSFSFSAQRHSFDSETAVGTGGSAMSEVVMRQPPGVVTTEPLSGVLAPAFAPPPMVEWAASAGNEAAGAAFLPPAPSPNQRPVLSSSSAPLTPLSLMPAVQAPSAPLLQPQPQAELAAQIDQLRNDIFGIAMSVSALNDRLDRLDQRVPQATAGLAALRAEIGSWLENHLSTAVEQCLHRMAGSTPGAAPAT